MENFYMMFVGPLALFIPATSAALMIPSLDRNEPGPLRPSTWLYGTIMFYLALAIGSIRPDTWGYAIVFGSIVAGLLLIASWIGFYKMGRNK
jgi:hypothetical protein